MVKWIEQWRLSSHRYGKYWLLFALIWFLFDQATKQLAIYYLKPIGSISIVGDFLRLTYAENTGMAFSISILPSWFLLITAIITSVLLTLWIWKIDSGFIYNLAFSLVLAGALGNGIDRLLYGYVIDFIDVDFFDFILLRWPIFNLADSGVTIAIILIIISTFFQKNRLQVNSTQSSDLS
ncbi:MAG: signal peptidase II [bacterium]|nr:signal peptidase II [bacterium]